MNFGMNQKRSIHDRGPGQAAATQPTPAVPISVYRELAAELQATQTMLDSLHAQNRHLRKANQQMQFELDHIIESAHKMQQISAPSPSAAHSTISQPGQASQGHAVQGKATPPAQGSPKASRQGMVTRPAEAAQAHNVSSPIPQEALDAPARPAAARPKKKVRKRPPAPRSEREVAVEALNKLFTGREEQRLRPKLSPDGSSEISSWWLMVMVLFIVVTAFGTGFLLVRPFLSQSSSSS